MQDFQYIIDFIRQIFSTQDKIYLHEPYFGGNEKKYLNETIDSTFVSSIGKFVDSFELRLAEYTGSKRAVVCVNGTNALHMAMIVNGVKEDDEIVTQALTFIATPNAISYIGAKPVFIDVDRDTLGMSPEALKSFLERKAYIHSDGFTYNKETRNRISACIPMHTFGLPLRIDEISRICDEWNITLIEDAAESLGSFYKERHTGTFGKMAAISFNGNKIITSGGGGAIITNDVELANKAKHLTTQAKISHPWKFTHDDIGYNYRMPNLNSALAYAQLEQIDKFLQNKRDLSDKYDAFFKDKNIHFIKEIVGARSNYWLNAIIFNSQSERDDFLEFTNNNGVMTRPIWDLMIDMPMFANCQNDGLENSRWLAERVVNLPSSYRP